MEPFVGQILMVGFNFAPKGWALCNGQLLPINQNQALFSILGTMYGGDGRTNFALPNLQGRMPLHQGAGYNGGQAGGEAGHTLTTSEMPTHRHPAVAQSAATNPGVSPAGAIWAQAPAPAYAPAPNIEMNPAAVQNGG